MPTILPAALSAKRGCVPLVMTEIEQMGGAERSLLALARWLHRRNLPVHLVAYFDHCNLAQYADFPLQVVPLQPAGGARAKIAALRAYFAGWQGPAPLLSGYQPALHATLAGIKKFHCLMHDTPALFQPVDERTWSSKLRLAVSNRIIQHGFRGENRMIVTSEFLQHDCWRDFRVRADIARMGGFTTSASFRRRRLDGSLRSLSVCRIENNKRIDWLLGAFAELEQAPLPLSKRVDWRLDLAGKGSLLESMRACAEQLGLGERIQFHGFVTDADLDALYSEAHLFLMPAVQGYGIPAVEALERGIPVVLHRESGVSDILLDTPWAAVLHGGKEEMRPRLEAMIEWLLQNGQMTAEPPPHLPSEQEWAGRVAQLCGYVP